MIRRQISISVPPRTVWNALTTPEGLSRWLATDVRIDPRTGGRIVLKVRGEGDGEPVEEAGFLHVWRPTAKLEITWDKASPGPWKSTFTQFQVARDGSETVLNVQHDGPAFEDDDARNAADALWKRALLSLRDGLEG